MGYTIKKSNLSDENRGICGNRNNSRYTGRSVVWVLMHNGENLGHWKGKAVVQRMADYADDHSIDPTIDFDKIAYLAGINRLDLM